MSKFASSILTKRSAGVNSVESGIEYPKFPLVGRFLSVPNIPVTVKKMFRTGIDSIHDEKISSIGVLSTLFKASCEHDILMYLEEWCRIATFPTYKVL